MLAVAQGLAAGAVTLSAMSSEVSLEAQRGVSIEQARLVTAGIAVRYTACFTLLRFSASPSLVFSQLYWKLMNLVALQTREVIFCGPIRDLNGTLRVPSGQ